MIKADATREVNRSVEELSMPLANVNPEPRPFQQYVSEVPTGPIATVKPALYQYTRSSLRKKIKGNCVLAAYILKHQSQEMVFQVHSIYSVIRDIVFNFDRTHEESFFEAYPHLLLQDSLHAEASLDYTPQRRLELRKDYRKYCVRLAHYYAYYIDFRTRWIEQLVNLLNDTRFNSDVQRADIASLARWSQINPKTKLHNAFLAPNGACQAIAEASKFGIGSGANGNTIIALPVWDSSVYGNVGNHAGSLKELLTDHDLDYLTTSIDGQASLLMQGSAAGVDPDDSNQDYLDARYLRRVANEIACQYNDLISAPLILNASTLSIKGTSEEAIVHMPLAQSGINFDAAKTAVESTVVTDIAWANIKKLEDICQAEFPEMRDPNNDLYLFAVNQLHLLELPVTVEGMLSVVRDLPFYDITDLRNHMVFRNNGEVNTSTVVGQSLPITEDADRSPLSDGYIYPGSSKSAFRSTFMWYSSIKDGGTLVMFRLQSGAVDPQVDVLRVSDSEAVDKITVARFNAIKTDPLASFQSGGVYYAYAKTTFERNFERYTLHVDNATQWLRVARRYPGVTPRTFTNAARETGSDKVLQPIILNGISADGPLFASNAGFQDTGKYATLLDLATRSNLDTQSAFIDFNGVTAEKAKQMVDRKDGFICYERPDQVWKYQKPWLDTSDPFQCGFYLMIAAEEVVDQSELASAFSDSDSYSLPPTSIDADDSTTVVTGITDRVVAAPLAEYLSAGRHDAFGSMFPTLRNTPHYAFIFLGDGIFMPPQGLSMQDSYALPYETSKSITPAQTITKFSGTQEQVAALIAAYLDTDKTVESSLIASQGSTLIDLIKPGLSTDFLTLLRLAGLQRFSTAALTRAIKLTARVSGTDVQVVKPSACLATLLRDRLFSDGGVRLYMFNPQYGPVAIITAPMPLQALAHVSPERESTVAEYARGSLASTMVMNLGAFRDTGATIDYNDRMSFLSTRTASHLWTWWLRKFSVNLAYVDGIGSPQVKGGQPIVLDDAIRAKWALALFEAVTVNYAGVGDMKYFNDYAKGVAAFRNPESTIVTASSYPVQHVVSLPRRSRPDVPQKGANISGKDRSTTSYSIAQLQGAYESTPNSGGSSDSKSSRNPKRGRRHHSRGRVRSSTVVDAFAPTPSSRTSTEPADLPVSTLKPRDDGPFDQSSKKEDKDFAERKGKKPDAIALQM